MIRLALAALTCAIGVGIYDNPGLLGVTITRVEVSPTRLVSEEALAPLIGDFIGRPLRPRTCEELRVRLLQHWAVESVHVRRVWPATIAVSVSELPLVARIVHPYPAAVDRSGRLIVRAEVPQTLPALSGWTPGDAWLPTLGTLECLAGLPAISEGSTVAGPPRDGSIEVTCPKLGVRLVLPCPPDEGLAARLAFVGTVVADMQARGERLQVVDLRWSNQIVAGGAQG